MTNVCYSPTFIKQPRNTQSAPTHTSWRWGPLPAPHSPPVSQPGRWQPILLTSVMMAFLSAALRARCASSMGASFMLDTMSAEHSTKSFFIKSRWSIVRSASPAERQFVETMGVTCVEMGEMKELQVVSVGGRDGRQGRYRR